MGDVHRGSGPTDGAGLERVAPAPVDPHRLRRSAPHRVDLAFRSPAAWTILLLTAIIGLSLDLSTKSWAFAAASDAPVVLDREVLVENPHVDPVPRNATVQLVPHLLQVRLVINRGAVFGLGANQRLFFVAFTLAALLGGVCIFGWMSSPRCRIGHLGIGLVFAGGLGNLYDRVRFGAVRDFLHTLPGRRLPFEWRWPGGNPELCPWVFNVADVLLLIGMVLLMTHLSRRRARMADAQPITAVAHEGPAVDARP